MNKLFTKIAALSVGLVMAVGVGVAIGGRTAKVVKATKYVAYTLDCSKATAVSGDPTYSNDSNYNKATSTSQSDVAWNIYGNTAIEPWRIGGKGAANYVTNTYDRTISSQNPVSSEAISEVELEIGTISSSSSFTINSFTMTVSTEVDGGGSVESSLTGTIAASSTTKFTLPAGKDWSSKYFMFTANVSCKGGKSSASNVYFQLISVKFNYEVEVSNPDTITVSGESSVNVGATTQLTSVATKSGSSEGVNQNVVWSSSNPVVARIDQDGLVTGVGNGTATIYATAENDDTVVGSKSITVVGGKSDNLAFVIVPDVLPASYGDKYVTHQGVYLHVKSTMKNSGLIQIQKDNGLVENIAPLPYDISKIEISFNADKSQGTGFAIKASTDGETYVSLEAEQVRSNRFAYSAPSTGYVYFQITAPTSGTLYLDEILVGLGNDNESKLVALATALNGLLDSECAGSGDTSPITASKWSEVEAAYTGGDEDAKTALAGVDSLSYIEVNQFLSRYDYIVGRYGFNDFLNRNPAPIGNAYHGLTVSMEDNSMTIIIVVIAATSAIALSVLLLLKKRKQK